MTHFPSVYSAASHSATALPYRYDLAGLVSGTFTAAVIGATNSVDLERQVEKDAEQGLRGVPQAVPQEVRPRGGYVPPHRLLHDPRRVLLGRRLRWAGHPRGRERRPPPGEQPAPGERRQSRNRVRHDQCHRSPASGADDTGDSEDRQDVGRSRAEARGRGGSSLSRSVLVGEKSRGIFRIMCICI